ncbi:piggyBac transposable element-derived protein 3-like [Anthonomus grandis grandis]|uniref:piggyBac transposable element-derived protein 3-like n=1 Tax=Anthonomus grandis grandis TaxID=2921223 RepID=UPI0021659E71|nr:piggyBac transposable element-derived protein 3-like [Anthonomus grandis grandis]
MAISSNCTKQSFPGNIFKLFFDENLVGEIVNFTNIYAQQKNRPGNVTVDEMYCFIGVLLFSGYTTVLRRHMYWQNCNDTQNKLILAAISRGRFQIIMSNLHCSDNTSLDKKDKYSKLRPLFKSLNKKNFDYAPVEENHSLDETMIPYYGRHSGKQFIQGKPVRWGYKFWVGTLRLGYIVYFDPYQGASTTIPDKYKHLGLGASVVLQYVNVLQKMPYQPFHICFDKFFTSLSLLKKLKLRNIKATGTIRENRIPQSPFSNAAVLKKKTRGTFEWSVADNEIDLCKRNDNSVVTLASNAGSVLLANKVKRFSQAEKKHVYRSASIDQGIQRKYGRCRP